VKKHINGLPFVWDFSKQKYLDILNNNKYGRRKINARNSQKALHTKIRWALFVFENNN
jgi:hypothetical protein